MDTKLKIAAVQKAKQAEEAAASGSAMPPAGGDN